MNQNSISDHFFEAKPDLEILPSKRNRNEKLESFLDKHAKLENSQTIFDSENFSPVSSFKSLKKLPELS